jgi:hypothetical protein
MASSLTRCGGESEGLEKAAGGKGEVWVFIMVSFLLSSPNKN